MEPTIAVAVISAVVTVLLAVPATIVTIRKFPTERRQTEAETTEIITRAASGLVDELWAELERLRKEVETYKVAIEALQVSNRENEKRIADLERQLALAQARIKELEAQNEALKQENKELRLFYEKVNGQ